MTTLYLYPFAFLALFFFNKDKDKTLSSIVVLLYLVSSIFGIYVYNNFSRFSSSHIYWYAVLYHIIMLVLFLNSYKKLNHFVKLDLVKVRNTDVLNCLTIVVVLLCLLCNINAFLNIGYSFSGISAIDAQDTRALLTESQGSATFMDRLAYFGNKYALVALALSFYYMKYSPNRKLLIILLLFCSLSMIMPSLRVIGREYIIKYIFVFAIAYLLCRKKLSKSSKSILRSFILIIAVLGISYFIIISSLRFGERTDYIEKTGDSSMLNAIIAYFGQGFVLFSEFFEEFIYPKVPIGSIHFKFFSSDITSAYNLNDTVFANVFVNAFSTGVGDLMVDGGIFFATIIILLLVLCVRYVGRREFNLFTYIYILWLFEFVFSFLFFFNESFTGMRVLSLLIIFAFDIWNNQYSKKKQFRHDLV